MIRLFGELSKLKRKFLLLKAVSFFVLINLILVSTLFTSLIYRESISAQTLSAETYSENIVINEIMASNNSALQDNDGDYDDWLELKNISENAVNLSGYYLSDKEDDLKRWRFNTEKDLIIQPGAYLLVWADEELEEGELHSSFKLGSSGETVTLTAPDGNTIIDQIEYPELISDLSYGRQSGDISDWKYFVISTPAEENGGFGLSYYYTAEKIKFIMDNPYLITFFFLTFLIILLLFLSYYRISRKYSARKTQYENLFEECPVGLIISDIDKNVVDLNQEMVELLGAPDKRSVKGLKLGQVIDTDEILDNEVFSAADEVSGEIKYITSWGKEVVFKYRIEASRSDADQLQFILALNDISREKKIEEELISFFSRPADIFI